MSEPGTLRGLHIYNGIQSETNNKLQCESQIKRDILLSKMEGGLLSRTKHGRYRTGQEVRPIEGEGGDIMVDGSRRGVGVTLVSFRGSVSANDGRQRWSGSGGSCLHHLGRWMRNPRWRERGAARWERGWT